MHTTPPRLTEAEKRAIAEATVDTLMRSIARRVSTLRTKGTKMHGPIEEKIANNYEINTTLRVGRALRKQYYDLQDAALNLSQPNA